MNNTSLNFDAQVRSEQAQELKAVQTSETPQDLSKKPELLRQISGGAWYGDTSRPGLIDRGGRRGG